MTGQIMALIVIQTTRIASLLLLKLAWPLWKVSHVVAPKPMVAMQMRSYNAWPTPSKTWVLKLASKMAQHGRGYLWARKYGTILSNADPYSSSCRLITAHTALTTHLSHQTRTLLTLTHPLVSPLSAPPDPDLIDELLPILTSLVLALPAPTSHTLSSLHSLRASTTDLTSALTYLSDTLHMMRQTTSLASRRLRAARELVVEMRRETEARETAMRWVEKGEWEGRLAGRECARVCGEVVDGFEKVCESWRRRLAGGMAGVEVGVA